MRIPATRWKFDFDDMRPYYDHEVQPALRRLAGDPLFRKLLDFAGLPFTETEVREKISRINSSYGFQQAFMHAGIRSILARSGSELSFSGFEHLQPGTGMLFVSNHRDILLDPAILQVLLVEHGLDTSEITFGENLMTPGFITDFGRLNRMFRVVRQASSRELYDIAEKLSAYIRHTIADKKVSIWIAQRNGRTKDGNDLTQSGLLKMLLLSGGDHDPATSLSMLNIVPMSISYEYEPCDALKTQEVYLSSLLSKYVKASDEDLKSIVQGACQKKGRIHLALGVPFSQSLVRLQTAGHRMGQLRLIRELLDREILSNYRLWPTHFIAADLLTGRATHAGRYTPEEKTKFEAHLEAGLDGLKGPREALWRIFLSIYANPVFNRIRTNRLPE
jgi:hypothetical protein